MDDALTIVPESYLVAGLYQENIVNTEVLVIMACSCYDYRHVLAFINIALIQKPTSSREIVEQLSKVRVCMFLLSKGQ